MGTAARAILIQRLAAVELQPLRDGVFAAQSLTAMQPLVTALLDMCPPRDTDGQRRLPLHLRLAPFLQDVSASRHGIALRTQAWGGWRGLFGYFHRDEQGRRVCPLCAGRVSGGAALTVPHLVRDCIALAPARAAHWINTRARCPPEIVAVMPLAIPPVGAPHCDIFLHLVLGIPPLGFGLYSAAEWAECARRGSPRCPYVPLFAAFRAALPFLELISHRVQPLIDARFARQVEIRRQRQRQQSLVAAQSGAVGLDALTVAAVPHAPRHDPAN